ncbi:MAG: OprO/OprP family phosphate-selective porin [Microscillaceae bacterium]|jgi:hypothetical protein|nr:OprO/OprP family phosphate-selective porin [Microscillaceae bacterium]
MKFIKIALICLGLCGAYDASAQTYFKKPDSLYKFFQPFAQMQIWTTYTINEKQDLDNNGTLETVDNRLTVMFRRARLGFRGEPYKGLRYQVILFYDQMGKDDLSAVRGNYNDNAVGVFDAFGQWKMSKKSDFWHLTFGFFRPQISRESITSFLSVNSFEKGIDQTYTRLHTIGRNNGRSFGINLGGMKHQGNFGINYNVGLFNNYGINNQLGNVGARWSPVVVGRVALTWGQAEMKNYAINYETNFYNQRKGITLAAVTSQQGATDSFDNSRAYGLDWLANYGPINFDGEWTWLQRHRNRQKYQSQSGHLRLGINTIIAKKYFIEPTFMFAYFKGQDNNGEVRFFDGEDIVYDMGVNWYIDRRSLKLLLHYVIQNGNGNNNIYTRQNGRAVTKGDYVGLGLNIIL